MYNKAKIRLGPVKERKMLSSIMFVVLAFLVTFVAVATYLLWPVPILCYKQNTSGVERGTVVEVKKIRPGVTQVGISHNLKIDPKLKEGDARITQASYTSFLHFRGNMRIPKEGTLIKAAYVNKYHRFTGNSYNWVTSWNVCDDVMSPEGFVTAW